MFVFSCPGWLATIRYIYTCIKQQLSAAAAPLDLVWLTPNRDSVNFLKQRCSSEQLQVASCN